MRYLKLIAGLLVWLALCGFGGQGGSSAGSAPASSTQGIGGGVTNTLGADSVANVLNFGATHDLQKITDISMASGSSTITSASPHWSSADTGKYGCVRGAASGGGDACGTLTYVSATQLTASFTNASGGQIGPGGGGGSFVNAWPSSGGVTTINTTTGGTVGGNPQIQVGDFLVTWWAGGLAMNTLSGWTVTNACTNSGYFFCIYTKVATSGDVGATYTWTGGQFETGGLADFRGYGAVDAHAGTGATSTAPVAPSITPTNSNDVLISMEAIPPTATVGLPSGFSTAFTEAGVGGVNFASGMGYKLNISSGATGSVAWGTIASGAWSAANLALTAAAGGTFYWGTDNTAAFSAAVAALTHGGEVWIPAGDYMICGGATSACIVTPDPELIPINFIGAANGQMSGAAGQAATQAGTGLYSASTTAPVFNLHANPNTYGTHSSIRHMSINYGTASTTNFTSGSADCIDIEGVSHTTIEDVSCVRFPNDGLMLTDLNQFGMTDIHVIDSDFVSNGQYGVDIPSGQKFPQDYHFDNILVTGSQKDGFFVNNIVHGWEVNGGSLFQANDQINSNSYDDMTIAVAQKGCHIHGNYFEADLSNEHAVFLADGSCEFDANTAVHSGSGKAWVVIGTFASGFNFSTFNNNNFDQMTLQCASGMKGLHGMILDASTATPSFGDTYGGNGTGTNVNSIGCDGTNWRYGW